MALIIRTASQQILLGSHLLGGQSALQIEQEAMNVLFSPLFTIKSLQHPTRGVFFRTVADIPQLRLLDFCQPLRIGNWFRSIDKI